MKYYESDKKFAKTIGNVGFYTIIVCCLLAIGVASFFAVSKFRTSDKDTKIKDNSSAYDGGKNTYNSKDDVTENPIESREDTTSAQKNESSVPYESKKEAEPKEEIISFRMPVDSGKVIKGYADNVLQYSETYGDMRLHQGIDISCNKSSFVKSCSKGTVKTISENTELGRYIEIEHQNGIVVRYCGLESVNVQSGNTVNAGDIIGTVGTVTGECMDASHIHIEVYKNSVLINPSTLIGS